MHNVLLFLKRFNHNFRWLGIVLVFVLAALMRLPDVALIKCDYLSDCGRDLLAAKHIADGTASFWTSPISAVSILPNTPFYYLILAVWYRIGGLLAIAYFNFVIGVLAVWLTYLIVLEITQHKILSWFAAVIMAVLPYMISTSVTIWQPHWELLFGGFSIWLCLRALRTKKLAWHYAAVVSLWPLIHQAYLALPAAGIMTVWLAWSGWQIVRKQKAGFQKFGLLLALAFTWITWLVLVVSLWPFDAYIEFRKLIDQQSISFAKVVLREQVLVRFLIDFFSHSSNFLWMWQWLLPLPVMAGIYRWKKTKKPIEKIQLGFLFSLLLPLLFVFLDPGTTVDEWHFLLQQYVFFLCLVLIPYFLQFSKRATIGFSVFLLVVLLYQNRFLLNRTFTIQEPMFQQAENLAKIIAIDVEVLQAHPTQVSLAMKNETSSQDDLEILSDHYATAGVQLALEQLDPRYNARVKVAPIHERWSNYAQPHGDIYYVICVREKPSIAAECVENLYLHDSVIVEKTFLEIVPITARTSAALYRLRLQRVASQ